MERWIDVRPNDIRRVGVKERGRSGPGALRGRVLRSGRRGDGWIASDAGCRPAKGADRWYPGCGQRHGAPLSEWARSRGSVEWLASGRWAVWKAGGGGIGRAHRSDVRERAWKLNQAVTAGGERRFVRIAKPRAARPAAAGDAVRAVCLRLDHRAAVEEQGDDIDRRAQMVARLDRGEHAAAGQRKGLDELVGEVRPGERLAGEIAGHPPRGALGELFGGQAELAETADDLGDVLVLRLEQQDVAGAAILGQLAYREGPLAPVGEQLAHRPDLAIGDLERQAGEEGRSGLAQQRAALDACDRRERGRGDVALDPAAAARVETVAHQARRDGRPEPVDDRQEAILDDIEGWCVFVVC